MNTNTRKVLAPALAALVAAGAAHAADEPTKRAEGRYFIEAAEVMFRANDFDAVTANVDPDGFAGPRPSAPSVSKLSDWKIQQPRMMFGLNRPGKTTLTFEVTDLEHADKLIPQDFDNDTGSVITSPLLPPGVMFQRQHVDSPGLQRTDDDFVPNWGEIQAYINRYDYKSLEFSVRRTFYENKHARLRWMGGLRYAELEQKLGFRLAYAQESVGQDAWVRDFGSVQAAAVTHGLGPHFGLEASAFVGKKKKWTFYGQADVAFIPESTNASYLLSLVDNSAELWVDNNGTPADPSDDRVFSNPEAPVVPGLILNGRPQSLQHGRGSPFTAAVHQTDFTEMTYLVEGRAGFRFQITRAVSVGLEGWRLQWMNLLSRAGIFDTIHEQATYEEYTPQDNPDPQLHDFESAIHVPRFSKRDAATFDGVSLNLRFEF